MGYTHTFKLTKQPTEKQIEKVVNEVKMLHSVLPEYSETAGGYHNDEPLVIKGFLGKGVPIFDNEEILFNGNAEDHTRLDDFHLKFEKGYTDYCKTGRNPYDMLVCLVLLSAKSRIPGFTFWGDGDLDDWQPAIDFYRQHVKSDSKPFEKWCTYKPK